MADHPVRTSKADLADSWCWTYASEQDRRYHLEEWGVPVHDERRMFDHFSLECLQCGLSWNLILQRRDVVRACFAGFDVDAVAGMGDADVERILATPGMIRSPRKVRAVINNARCVLTMHDGGVSFDEYFWNWTGHKTILYQGHEQGGIPAKNGLSTRIAADLKRRGFRYVGPTNVYAHLQACGLVCDHNEDCPRYHYVVENHPCVRMPRDDER